MRMEIEWEWGSWLLGVYWWHGRLTGAWELWLHLIPCLTIKLRGR